MQSENFDPKRIFMFADEVNGGSIKAFLDQSREAIIESSASPLLHVIQTNGGILSAGFSYYELVRLFSLPVSTLAPSDILSTGLVMFQAGGLWGKRYVTESTRCLIHEVENRYKDTSMDIHEMEVSKKMLLHLRDRWKNIIMAHVKPKVTRSMLDDMLKSQAVLNGKEMVKLGFADKLVTEFVR